MYQRVECDLCGKLNLSNVVKCSCGSEKSKISHVDRCVVPGCFDKHELEPSGGGRMICRNHGDDLVLSKYPDSPRAELVRRMRSENKAHQENIL